MFLGTYTPKLDDKGRLTLPAKFRDALAEGLVMTKGQDRCLVVWTREGFAEYAARYVGDHIRTCKLRPSTAEHMHTVLKQHLIPMLGKLRVDQVSDDQIMEIKSLSLAAGTIKRMDRKKGHYPVSTSSMSSPAVPMVVARQHP